VDAKAQFRSLAEPWADTGMYRPRFLGHRIAAYAA
jgi:hypothetical protein